MPEPTPPSPGGPAPDLSLVVPVHDEEGNLEPLWGEIRALLDRLDRRAEVIFVNDGSKDASGEILDRLRATDARIRVIDHDRNHGLTSALDCGFRHARGAVIGMLDADMQNPPGEIEKLLARLGSVDPGSVDPRSVDPRSAGQDGVDMVIGWRRDRTDPWLKKISSKIGNAYRNRRTQEQVHDTGCGLKVFRREILARVKLFNGMHRFLPTLARMEGFRVAEVPVLHRPRASGRSHYGVWNRLWKGLADVKAIRWMWKNRLRYVATERPPLPSMLSSPSSSAASSSTAPDLATRTSRSPGPRS